MVRPLPRNYPNVPHDYRTSRSMCRFLIHSVNASQAPVMADRLESAGFWVTRVPMDKLTKEKLDDWLEEVREIWQDLQEE